jgi:NAD(P)-dependent dehydrogenase (short-subunit alcohol dehydrogenase family)
MGRLADKNILISGGNGGIGLAAAQDFDREGARVAVKLDHVTRTYRRDKFEVRALDDVFSHYPDTGVRGDHGPFGVWENHFAEPGRRY